MAAKFVKLLLRLHFVLPEICRRCCSWTVAALCGRSCVLQLKEPCCCIRQWSLTESADGADNTTNIWLHQRMDPDDQMYTHWKNISVKFWGLLHSITNAGDKTIQILYIFHHLYILQQKHIKNLKIFWIKILKKKVFSVKMFKYYNTDCLWLATVVSATCSAVCSSLCNITSWCS